MNMLPKFLVFLMRAIILAIAIYYLVSGDLFAATLSLAAFGLSLLPMLINAAYGVELHWIFEASFAFMLFWHMLGFMGGYELFSLWDVVGHFWGGATIALIGFGWLYSMHISGRIRLTLSMVALVSVMWSTTIGVLWEIFEFMWDSSSGLVNVYGLAQNGLIDTMTDLSLDLMSAILMASLCVYFAGRASRSVKSRVVNPFVRILEKD